MIFVTGCARSGTSLTTAVLSACGANIGEVTEHKEHYKAREKVIKPAISAFGGDPSGIYPLPDIEKIVDIPDFGDHLTSVLKGADTYKCVKLLLIWPLVLHHFPDAKWIICRREINNIAKSCLKAPFLKGKNGGSIDEWSKWSLEYIDRIGQLKDATDNYIEVWPGEAFQYGGPETFRNSVEFASLEFDYDAVESVMDRSKWHHS